MYIMNNKGPRIDPCGTPYSIFCLSDNFPFTLQHCVLFSRYDLFKAVVDLKQEVNNPGEQNPETHLFVTPPNILKQQLTGYCTSPASSPMGRDNKHGWYEEHEKFVAIATRSLSSVLLVGDSLVNGLARYHRVWSKYL